MFANAIRTQARLALSSCRARTSLATAVRLVPRGQMVPVSIASRPLSTSRTVFNDYESSGFARDVAPVRKANPPSNSLFVGNLPYSVEQEEIREKFQPYGEITSVRVAFRPDGTARGFAHVEFANEADAVAAFESMTAEPAYILDRDLRVDYAGQRTTRTSSESEPFHKLYFSGFRGDERLLRSAIQQFESSVIDVFFLKDRETGERTDAGFIDFMSVERATEALNELNGQDVGEGLTLSLQFARPPKQRSEGGQRRSGGNWGGERRSDRRGGSNSGGRGGYEGSRGGRQGGYGGGRRDEGYGGGRRDEGYGGGRY